MSAGLLVAWGGVTGRLHGDQESALSVSDATFSFSPACFPRFVGRSLASPTACAVDPSAVDFGCRGSARGRDRATQAGRRRRAAALAGVEGDAQQLQGDDADDPTLIERVVRWRRPSKNPAKAAVRALAVLECYDPAEWAGLP